jgi:ABC-type polysaccharide/polyol phosphate transport system ATPase subunit
MLEEDGNNRPLLQSTSSAGKRSVSKEGLFTTEETKGDEAKPEAKEKTLDNIVTLKDIDLQISKGELVIIIGDVGSGKSSLL